MKVKCWKEPDRSPKSAVDILVVKNNKILLLKRAKYPFEGKLVYPGGMVEYGETVEQAAIREAKEETGLKIEIREILGVYSSPKRDPRFHSISSAFIAESVGGKIKSSFEGKVKWYDIKKIKSKELGFDHTKILNAYLKWKKKKGTYWSTK